MNISKIIQLANASGGTLYLMAVLLLVALTVIVDRVTYLSRMEQGGEELMRLLKPGNALNSPVTKTALSRYVKLPHVRLFEAAMIEPNDAPRDLYASHLEEAVMREVPSLDRSLWMLDTVITLAPLLGLFGTIVGMFSTFSILGDAQNNATQVTGGIAEALLATASGLFVAMIGLVFFNWLNTKVRLIVHQLETIKVMLLNRCFVGVSAEAPSAHATLKVV